MNAWLHRIKDPELIQRIRNVLRKLEGLSEAKSLSYVPAHTGGKTAESAPPAGAMPDRPSSAPPPKDRSLYEWYLWHFIRAPNELRMMMLCYLAERDYIVATQGLPAHRIAGRPERMSENDEAERVVQLYEGIHYLEVSVLEWCSPGWIQKVRREARRNPVDGLAQSGWDQLTHDEKVTLISSYKRPDGTWRMRVNTVAGKLGIRPVTVMKWSAKIEKEAA